jgi:hypothetical protein
VRACVCLLLVDTVKNTRISEHWFRLTLSPCASPKEEHHKTWLDFHPENITTLDCSIPAELGLQHDWIFTKHDGSCDACPTTLTGSQSLVFCIPRLGWVVSGQSNTPLTSSTNGRWNRWLHVASTTPWPTLTGKGGRRQVAISIITWQGKPVAKLYIV